MFDNALLESARSRRDRGKGAGLPLAVAAHLILIGAFVGASAWTVGDPTEPEARIDGFPVVLRSSEPHPPSGGSPPPSVAHSRNVLSAPPTSLPPDLPAPEQSKLSPGPGDSGTDTEAPGPGSGPGDPFGTGDGSGPGPGGPGDSGGADPILRPGGDVTAPGLLTRVEPGYPEAARRARLEGTVILEAVITASGDVHDVHVLKSANPLLDAAAAQAVRQWRYRPATLNGRAVSVYLTVTVRFGLMD